MGVGANTPQKVHRPIRQRYMCVRVVCVCVYEGGWGGEQANACQEMNWPCTDVVALGGERRRQVQLSYACAPAHPELIRQSLRRQYVNTGLNVLHGIAPARPRGARRVGTLLESNPRLLNLRY